MRTVRRGGLVDAVVVYDSRFGNTEEVARAVADGLGGARVIVMHGLTPSEIRGADLVVMGTPNHRWGLSPAVTRALSWLRREDCKGMRCAAFEIRARRRLLRSTGKRLLRALRRRGMRPVARTAYFTVLGPAGPLGRDELGRARTWGAELARQLADGPVGGLAEDLA